MEWHGLIVRLSLIVENINSDVSIDLGGQIAVLAEEQDLGRKSSRRLVHRHSLSRLPQTQNADHRVFGPCFGKIILRHFEQARCRTSGQSKDRTDNSEPGKPLSHDLNSSSS